nr:MAG TPA: hypothetical protein [Caudoviricetes sp.]DAG46204.1 MAG TPA: hypothetical protein [Caudoviricetes sp.]
MPFLKDTYIFQLCTFIIAKKNHLSVILFFSFFRF